MMAEHVESSHKLFNALVDYFGDCAGCADPEWAALSILEIFDTFASNEIAEYALGIARDMTLK